MNMAVSPKVNCIVMLKLTTRALVLATRALKVAPQPRAAAAAQMKRTPLRITQPSAMHL